MEYNAGWAGKGDRVMPRKSVLATMLVAALLVAAYAVWPRRADLRAFEPTGMAQFETAMWRDYYEKRYPAQFYHLYEMSRTQFGFSPSDSLRIALAAARAAKAFQLTGRARRRPRPCRSSSCTTACCGRRRPTG